MPLPGDTIDRCTPTGWETQPHSTAIARSSPRQFHMFSGLVLRTAMFSCHTRRMAVSFASVGALALPPEAASAGPARRFVQKLLGDFGLASDVVDAAVLLTSELVTNAVLHTGSAVELRVAVRVGVGTRIEVRDGSELLPLARVHDADSVTGRGLHLVEMLASAFGVVSVPGGGKSVWFVVGDDAGVGSAKGWGEPLLEPSGIRVDLRHLPVVLFEVMREHHEALLREYGLLLLEREGEQAQQLHDVAAVERGLQLVDAAEAAWRSTWSGATAPDHADLTVATPATDRRGYDLALGVLAAAEGEARDGRLLTRPALPEVGLLRTWLVEQVVSQLRGGRPTPWEFTEATTNVPLAAGMDTSWVHGTEQAVLVADETNHIVAASAAVTSILGWTVTELIGQRLTMIIPARLRESHVAGFTRQLVTGRRLLLDRQIELPALHRDGHEVPVPVTLKKETENGRALFAAWLSPA